MPLDERERKILEEIERQFYEEDPDLVRKVQRIGFTSPWVIRLGVLGVVIGAVVLIATFTWQPLVAFAGFVVMVLSASAVIQATRVRRTAPGTPAPVVGSWFAKVKDAFRFKRG